MGKKSTLNSESSHFLAAVPSAQPLKKRLGFPDDEPRHYFSGSRFKNSGETPMSPFSGLYPTQIKEPVVDNFQVFKGAGCHRSRYSESSCGFAAHATDEKKRLEGGSPLPLRRSRTTAIQNPFSKQLNMW